MTPEPTNLPATFRDLAGREWTIRLDFGLLRKIRNEVSVDLGNVEQLSLSWATVLYDDCKAVDVLWIAVASAAASRQVDRQAFEESLNGEVLQTALHALKEAVESFTQPRKRGMATSAMEGIEKGMKTAIEDAETKIQNAIVKATAQAISGSSPPSTPES